MNIKKNLTAFVVALSVLTSSAGSCMHDQDDWMMQGAKTVFKLCVNAIKDNTNDDYKLDKPTNSSAMCGVSRGADVAFIIATAGLMNSGPGTVVVALFEIAGFMFDMYTKNTAAAAA